MSEEIKFTIDDKPPASSADKPRRGRPPGSRNKTSSAGANKSESATLSQALKTMDSLYEMSAAGLMLFGLTGTAELWANQTETLRESNKSALAASPRLAAAIASAGSVGGAAAFFSAHIMAIAPVALMARMELAARRIPPTEEAPADPDNVTRIPGV